MDLKRDQSVTLENIRKKTVKPTLELNTKEEDATRIIKFNISIGFIAHNLCGYAFLMQNVFLNYTHIYRIKTFEMQYYRKKQIISWTDRMISGKVSKKVLGKDDCGKLLGNGEFNGQAIFPT